MKINLLLIEDDEDFGIILKQYLGLSDFKVTWIKNPLDALALIEEKFDHDIILLDVMMPHLDGFSLAQKIKEKHPNLPFIFLTAKNQKIDRLTGLKIGADDYQTKPCDPDELILRIHNILKRSKPIHLPKPISIGSYSFDYENLVLLHPNEKIRLTQREADLLQLLIQYNHGLIKRDVILNSIWSSDDYFSGRSMDVFISRLRKYFQYDKSIVIQSIRAVGFEINFPIPE
ncbi:response regulator transcription factor [Flavobacterium sp. NKUCC04_CG]|uniref:response regulator transcription factor n=1 Tax=Flavobacterium sp. NKUCC04_CG TaxID=2842121 RepID=UPI001C5B0B17|nr:response regulator transcription factor [Flavobacterium sp. NKUCC04_CG]MBW3519568.1 response regulator transcription factor [Flavobacterium sp. NKUCC04_CG]